MDSKKFWNKQAIKFSKSENREAKELVDQSIDFIKGKDILDFACGTGGSSILLADHATSVLGIDYSEEMIHYAQGYQRHNLTYQVATLDSSDLATYDVITAFNVLHLLEDLDQASRRMNDLLRPGGILIAYTACSKKKGLITSGLALLSKLKFLPKIQLLTPERLDRYFESQGFVKVTSHVAGASVLNYYMVFKKAK